MVTKELNYIVETYEHNYFHLAYIRDEIVWRLTWEVGLEFFALTIIYILLTFLNSLNQKLISYI